jgi:hypothetical protein
MPHGGLSIHPGKRNTAQRIGVERGEWHGEGICSLPPLVLFCPKKTKSWAPFQFIMEHDFCHRPKRSNAQEWSSMTRRPTKNNIQWIFAEEFFFDPRVTGRHNRRTDDEDPHNNPRESNPSYIWAIMGLQASWRQRTWPTPSSQLDEKRRLRSRDARGAVVFLAHVAPSWYATTGSW